MFPQQLHLHRPTQHVVAAGRCSTPYLCKCLPVPSGFKLLQKLPPRQPPMRIVQPSWAQGRHIQGALACVSLQLLSEGAMHGASVLHFHFAGAPAATGGAAGRA